MLAVMPASDWEEYYKSLDVMAKDRIETAEDERLVGTLHLVVIHAGKPMERIS
jgi:hypothetical protein